MVVPGRTIKSIMVAITTVVAVMAVNCAPFAVAAAAAVAGAAGHVPTTTGGSSAATLTYLENNNVVDFFNSFSTKTTNFEEKHRRSLLLPYVEEGTGHRHHNEDDIVSFLSTLDAQHNTAAGIGHSISNDNNNNNNETQVDDGKVEVEQFVRSLQQQNKQQKKRTANLGSGGFATQSSYLDVKLRGSGLFDNNDEGSPSTKRNYNNDMAVPRSYGGRSGPNEQQAGKEDTTTEESLTRSYGSGGSDGGDSKKMKRSKKGGGPKGGKQHGKREKGTYFCSLLSFWLFVQ